MPQPKVPPDLLGHRGGDVGGGIHELVGGGVEERAALAGGRLGPRGEGRGGGVDGVAGVVAAGCRGSCDRVAGQRVAALEGAPA
jgi:hypothetical protein